MKPFQIFLSLVAIFLVSLTGCSTPQSRAQERGTTFTSLSKKDQAAALKGELREGMTSDAVFVALGRPAKVLPGVEKGKKLERWVYTRIESQEIPAWNTIHERDSTGRIIAFQRYEPVQLNRVEDTFEVKFENDKVVGWQKL